jgi:hypothetical protein
MIDQIKMCRALPWTFVELDVFNMRTVPVFGMNLLLLYSTSTRSSRSATRILRTLGALSL